MRAAQQMKEDNRKIFMNVVTVLLSLTGKIHCILRSTSRTKNTQYVDIYCAYSLEDKKVEIKKITDEIASILRMPTYKSHAGIRILIPFGESVDGFLRNKICEALSLPVDKLAIEWL